jgi:hypothetical protein
MLNFFGVISSKKGRLLALDMLLNTECPNALDTPMDIVTPIKMGIAYVSCPDEDKNKS